MKGLKDKMRPLLGRVWWFGSLTSGTISIGLTYSVAISLSLLYYLGTVSFAQLITVLVVLFCAFVLLLVNFLLMYGAMKAKPHLLLPWVGVTIPSILALLIYTSIKFSALAPHQSVYIATIILSSYFSAVVITSFHQLKLEQSSKDTKVKVLSEIKDEEEGEGESRTDGPLPAEDVLVELITPPALPTPEEVISVSVPTTSKQLLSTNNPFLEDVFKVKVGKQVVHSTSMDIRSDFTPFKKEDDMDEEGEERMEPRSKLRIFLPQTADGEDSDFDFSFTDPVFDSSLCAVTNVN